MSEANIYIAVTTYENGLAKTNIHKVFVWERHMVPFADATVSGFLRNQFSLDEHQGILRVATTESNPNSNNVYTLNHFLEKMGELRNIAPT